MKPEKFADKLKLLNSLREKMHPLNQLVLDTIIRNDEPMEEHDLQWVDDMIDAIEPANRSGSEY